MDHETSKERTARKKREYYQKNKHKYRQWSNNRYHRTNPTTPQEVVQRIMELNQLLQVMIADGQAANNVMVKA